MKEEDTLKHFDSEDDKRIADAIEKSIEKAKPKLADNFGKRGKDTFDKFYEEVLRDIKTGKI